MHASTPKLMSLSTQNSNTKSDGKFIKGKKGSRLDERVSVHDVADDVADCNERVHEGRPEASYSQPEECRVRMYGDQHDDEEDGVSARATSQRQGLVLHPEAPGDPAGVCVNHSPRRPAQDGAQTLEMSAGRTLTSRRACESEHC
ncbi:hypothetical protein HPB48_013557 [Haemaphysalis longicornis]|uniref:Uncharacterized protein n=1 Tax=Haemaphysalis longicornis TaxID=44386 RepID=A0A9J6GAB2_HAELO|nr:hypothetical protein HPB48_013557 [Haemaphysalis longicornis]